jgi:hypothetical protein
MPSIPQSLLWISLVVLWLFVLVPMLVSKRDAVRRTSDVALATRVLNSGSARLRRKRPAAGHNSDPDWQPADEAEDDEVAEEAPRRSVVLAAVDPATAEPDYLDVDIVEEDSGALPVGSTLPDAQSDPATEEFESVAEAADEPADDPADDGTETAEETDDTGDEYEYVADSSGLEAPSEADLTMADAVSASRKRRLESTTAAAVSARKYKFRKRMIVGLAVALLGSAVAAYFVAPAAWWVCGGVGAVTVLYLGYLRRQTRIEERLRRRRAQRMMRSRLGVENTEDPNLDVVPERLRRPGTAVLEIDDEDPEFEHLDEVAFARHFDLPRAAGQ